MNHLVVLYYFLLALLAMGGLGIIAHTWKKTGLPLLRTVFLFHTLLFFHVLTANLNFYISDIAGAGFDHPVIQSIYTLFLFLLIGALGNLGPRLGAELTGRRWRGAPAWTMLILASTAVLFPILPLLEQVPAGEYLAHLWKWLYYGYANIVWIGLAIMLWQIFSRLKTMPRDETRRYALRFVLITLIFLPGLIADQMWEIFQLKLGWIVRGFTFEPLYVVALSAATAFYCLRRPVLATTLLDDAGRKNLREKYGLSPREWEVLELAAEGKTNLEIGERLFISEGTVKNHIHNILDKTKLRSRWELLKLLQP